MSERCPPKNKYCIMIECFGELDHELIESVFSLIDGRKKTGPMTTGKPGYIIRHLAMRHLGSTSWTQENIEVAVTELLEGLNKK